MLNSNICTDTFVLQYRCLQECSASICIIVPTLVASCVCVWGSPASCRFQQSILQGTVAGTCELASESCVPALPVSHTEMTALGFIIYETVVPHHTSTHPPAHTHGPARTHKPTHAHIHTHTHTHTSTRTDQHAHTPTHTDTHIHPLSAMFQHMFIFKKHTILYLLNFPLNNWASHYTNSIAVHKWIRELLLVSEKSNFLSDTALNKVVLGSQAL